MSNLEHLASFSYIKGSFVPISAGNNAVAGAASVLHGVIVSTHSNGAFRVINGTDATGVVVHGTYNPASGSSIVLYPIPLDCYNGVFIQANGTITATAIVS